MHVNFWVQIHEIPIGLFSENFARQIENFIEKFLENNAKSLSIGVRAFIRIRVLMDVRCPFKRWKKIIFESGNNTYVKFKYEKLTLFYFYCG